MEVNFDVNCFSPGPPVLLGYLMASSCATAGMQHNIDNSRAAPDMIKPSVPFGISKCGNADGLSQYDPGRRIKHKALSLIFPQA